MKTMQEIREWCNEHVTMKSRLDYYTGAADHYILTFENGDTYEYNDRGDAWKKTVEIKLNGELVNVTNYEYHNFGWRAVA